MTTEDELRLEVENVDLRRLLAQAGLAAADQKVAERLQRLVLEELHHRVQNTLAIVTAITTQSLRTAKSLDDGKEAIEQRLDPSLLEEHGALDISLVTDLPLFIDPFLLFNSEKPEYRALHDGLIKYLVFLRDKAQAGVADEPMLRAWYCFPEVKQTWLGFSVKGNQGSGLGIDFARALHGNLHRLFPTFGDEQITKGSHLEKVCLIREGVGKDNISDFVTNLIKDFLCSYTEEFATKHLIAELRRTVAISNGTFNYETETWSSKRYALPWIDGDYVILCPKDLLTRDENWINKIDLVRRFEEIPPAISDEQLRWQVSNYFQQVLPRYPRKEASQKEYDEAARQTILQFPQLIDYYIRQREQRGDEASSIASERVRLTEQLLILQLKELQRLLQSQTAFYSVPGNTYEEAHERVACRNRPKND